MGWKQQINRLLVEADARLSAIETEIGNADPDELLVQELAVTARALTTRVERLVYEEVESVLRVALAVNSIPATTADLRARITGIQADGPAATPESMIERLRQLNLLSGHLQSRIEDEVRRRLDEVQGT